MQVITDTASLSRLCKHLSTAQYITVDTEFIREKTYWPRLCLAQVAGQDEVAAIDPLAAGLELDPFLELLANKNVLKVFHAARQDVEIFYHLNGTIPNPLFDTQIAAMACGFGDSIAYETLVRRLANARIDKAQRFTDWSHRPLTKKQLEYALADVTHLRIVYEKLHAKLKATKRMGWLESEMTILTDPATYCSEPEDAWRRLKTRNANRRFLGTVREIAALRERMAQEQDVPRNRVLRDDAILEIAAQQPEDQDDLRRCRGIGKAAENRLGEAILAAVKTARGLPEAALPPQPKTPGKPGGIGPTVDLLKVLLKMKCEEHSVAQKLIATSEEIERIAADDEADVPALRGWRREVFGAAALDLKHGKIALAIEKGQVRLTPAKG
ncbi:MAG: ribonuclease D [Alphaproteobacteria bacterium]|nr:ribonuclease D [Alphaproteobacteria bacterium]